MSSQFLPELGQIKWAGRRSFILFDSDVAVKERVQSAEERLNCELAQRGAIVRKVRLPHGQDGEKVGLDDYLLTHSSEQLQKLALSTEPSPGAYEPPATIQTLMAREYPDTEWAMDEFILKGEVNLLFGDGGVGKSLFALHAAVGIANGGRFLSRQVHCMPVLGLFAEDSKAEVQRHLNTILNDRKIDPDQNLPIQLWCQPAEDTLLAVVPDNGVVQEQPRLHAIRAELAKIGEPALLILDSLADIFAFNESLRQPVNAAMKRVLGGLCREFGATVLVLAHPSKASMADGSHYSGSTAFNNAVRHRLTLEVIKKEQGLIEDGAPPRKLSVAKSNYGKLVEMTLWYGGYSIDELPQAPKVTSADEKEAVLKTVLDLIDRGIRVVNRNGPAGDARTLNELAKTIKERSFVSIPSKRVKDYLRQLTDVEILTYLAADKTVRPHVKARYKRGPKCLH